jgi:hypothetical protein
MLAYLCKGTFCENAAMSVELFLCCIVLINLYIGFFFSQFTLCEGSNHHQLNYASATLCLDCTMSFQFHHTFIYIFFRSPEYSPDDCNYLIEMWYSCGRWNTTFPMYILTLPFPK